MANTDALLTAAQNIAQAIGNAIGAFKNVQGAQNYPAISTATVVRVGAGRVAMVSVTTAGSTNGTIYDANQTGVTTAPIYTIPNTIGVVFVNLPVTNGIVVSPGTSQVVTVSYSAAT